MMGSKKKNIERHLSQTERPVQKGQSTQDKCQAARRMQDGKRKRCSGPTAQQVRNRGTCGKS